MLAQKLVEMPADYEFTNSWFAPQEPAWRELFGKIKPRRLLEIGCYEGRATTFMIEAASEYGDPDITCVDTWAGAVDLPLEAMAGVEGRFDQNTKIALSRCVNPVTFHKRKQPSLIALSEMVSNGEQFDFIYIDGSHTAPDVLTDAVLAFQLLPIGGVIVFDDYTWRMEPPGREDPLNMPKFAIDTFVNMFQRKLAWTPFGAGYAQFAIQKTAA
jgi:SAM-dependent methyltransferase